MQVNANKCLLIAADCGIIRIKLRTYVPTETARSAENEEDFRQTTADTGVYKQSLAGLTPITGLLPNIYGRIYKVAPEP